jgi:circadian clock protein KaiB
VHLIVEPIHWVLTLYVNGASPRSTAALVNIRKLCDHELAGRVDLTVVDIRTDPEAAIRDKIIAIPTLVKQQPAPIRYLVGDLANEERVRSALDIIPVADQP